MSFTKRAFMKHIIERHDGSAQQAMTIFSELCVQATECNDSRLREMYVQKGRRAEITVLPRIDELPVLDLLKCPHCAFLSTTAEGIRRHARREHVKSVEKDLSRSDTRTLEMFRGQTFWSRRGWRQFWVIHNDDCNPSEILEKSLEEEAEAGQSVLRKMENVECGVMYERTPFGNLTNLDKVLSHIGITWDNAVRLAAGTRVVDKYVDANCVGFVSFLMRKLIAEGRMVLESSSAWMNTDSIMRAVATPGPLKKSRQFYLYIFLMGQQENR